MRNHLAVGLAALLITEAGCVKQQVNTPRRPELALRGNMATIAHRCTDAVTSLSMEFASVGVPQRRPEELGPVDQIKCSSANERMPKIVQGIQTMLSDCRPIVQNHLIDSIPLLADGYRKNVTGIIDFEAQCGGGDTCLDAIRHADRKLAEVGWPVTAQSEPVAVPAPSDTKFDCDRLGDFKAAQRQMDLTCYVKPAANRGDRSDQNAMVLQRGQISVVVGTECLIQSQRRARKVK